MPSDARNAGKFPDNHDPKLPQWVRSRLKTVQKRRNCGVTHMACRCFIERIINLEAEVAELRKQVKEQTKPDEN